MDKIKIRFSEITNDPEKLKLLISSFGNYNVETSTMGGKVFWITLVESNGYKLQQNKITGLCRILDPKNFRQAWGTVSSLESAINGIFINEKKNILIDKIEEALIKLAEFKQKGLISEEDYNEKKKELLSKIG